MNVAATKQTNDDGEVPPWDESTPEEMVEEEAKKKTSKKKRQKEDFIEEVQEEVRATLKVESKYIKALSERYHDLVEETPDQEGMIIELRCYQERIELDEDPSSVPLDRLNGLIARIQAYKNRATVVETEAIASLLLWSNLFTDVKAEEEDCIDAILRLPEVQAQKNQALRQAAAKARLPPGLRRLYRVVDRGHTFAKIFDRQVKALKDNLAHAHEAVSRQVTVIQMQADLGEIRRPTRRVGIKDRHTAEEDD